MKYSSHQKLEMNITKIRDANSKLKLRMIDVWALYLCV